MEPKNASYENVNKAAADIAVIKLHHRQKLEGQTKLTNHRVAIFYSLNRTFGLSQSLIGQPSHTVTVGARYNSSIMTS